MNNEMAEIPRGWFSVRHAAIYADVSVSTIRNKWLKKGLRYTMTGRKVLIKREWIDEFLTLRSAVPDLDRIVDEAMNG